MKTHLPVFLSMALILFSFDAAADADDATPRDDGFLWDHPELVEVADSEMAFSAQSYNTAKNDSVFVMVYFNDGWVLMFSWFHVKAPLFDRWGMYALVADPEGQSWWVTHQPSGSDMSFSEDRLFVSDGRSFLSGTGMLYRLHVDLDGFSGDLLFDNVLPPWKPGSGLLPYTGDGRYYQHKVVSSPWARVSGTLSVGERTMEVEGQGYLEKSLFVNPLARFHSLIHAVRVYSGLEVPESERWHISVLDYRLGRAYGYRRVPRLTVARGDRWLFTARDYTIQVLEREAPGYAPYEYPKSIRISYKGESGYQLEGTFRAARLFNFTDVFDELPLWLRRIFQAFMRRPVYFRMTGVFEGVLTEPDGTVHQVELSGPYEYVVSQ